MGCRTLIFLGTIVAALVVGTQAKALFFLLLMNHHEDLYDALGRPPVWVNTSFSQGWQIQLLVFSNEPKLCYEAEAARRLLRMVTLSVIVALMAEMGFLAESVALALGLAAKRTASRNLY